MREIKFRAWFEDEMIFSDCPTGEFEFVFDDSGSMEFNAWNDEKHKLTPDGDVTYAGWDTYTTDIMQYTGMKDKNGKEIYEGDIIRKEMCAPDDMAYGFYGDIGIIEYHKNAMRYIIHREDNTCVFWDLSSCEIIGNIHENPELLLDVVS